MVLSAHDLGRSLGGRQLFSGLEFRLDPGMTLVVSGPSGSGKSQLLRGIAGLGPLQGTITLDGRTPAQWGLPQWRAEVVYVAQDVPGLPGCPEDFLALVARLGTQRARDTIDAREISAAFELPPEVWRKPWKTLSGGERQRVQLAIALSRRPQVLLLDEPTSALDPNAVAAVEASMRQRTTIWVTHSAAQAERVADATLVIS